VFKKIFENIIFVVLVVILGISISPVLPFKNIPRTYVVVSGSMEPIIKTGSVVLTKPIDPKMINTGDIVAFTSPSNPKNVILHRVVGLKSTEPLRFQTKGDNNNAPDSWDLMDVGILGQHVYTIPYVGYVINFVRTPVGFALLIVIPVILFVISQILNIKRYIKDEVDLQVKNKTLSTIFILFSLLSLSSIVFTKSIFAKFITQTTVTNIAFIVNNQLDDSPPKTEIIDLVSKTNIPIIISYFSEDTDIDYVKLCYAFNDPFFKTVQCNTDFNFDFPRGEGMYYFYTQATDKSGNTETVNPHSSEATVYDITPPTTNLIIDTTVPSFHGQNLLPQNNWTIIGNGITFTDGTIQLGIGDSNSIDILSQQIFLPKNVSSNLTFSYNFTTLDTSEFDNLVVGIGDSNIFYFGGSNSPGWQTITRSIAHWADKTVNLFFKLTNSGAGNSTSVLLKDIIISPLDLRTGDTAPAQFLATDLGIGIFDSTTTPENISSTDFAFNTENTHSISIVTLPPVVLNKISATSISLYNNTSSSIDLNGYTIDIGTTTVLSGVITAFSSLDIPLAVGDTKVSLLQDSVLVDSTTFESLGDATWTRQSNGLGPWVRLNAPLSFDLQNRLSQSKVTFTASGIGGTSTDLSYSILYFGNGSDQQISGNILPHTVDANGSVSRDFFLGTCSSGVCLPVLDLGSSFLVTFSGESKTIIFN